MAVCIGLSPLAGELMIMSSLPGEISEPVQMFCLISMAAFALVALVLGTYSILSLLSRQRQNSDFFRLLACLAFLPATALSLFFTHPIRQDGFMQLASRTKPLIAAIEKYEKVNGHAPDKLQDLIPGFMPAIPKTGIGAYPKYRYELLKKEKDSWQLTVDCSRGWLNWDEFYYLPSKKYPERYGGWVELMGDWAYFHE
ncbi:MAG: hypothetical protein C0507_15415 [Cyanobacteria bacterium PR.3.49]|nr:hypothetical protein [Cyanobacteria bacterium PR.3.49]